MGMKIVLSHACEVATATQLDMDLRSKDVEFGLSFQYYLLHVIQGFDSINPFQRCVIDVGFDAVGYVGSHGGSASGYSMLGHLITAKNKVGKRTVVNSSAWF